MAKQPVVEQDFGDVEFSSVTDEQIEESVRTVPVSNIDISSLLANFDIGKLIQEQVAEQIAKTQHNPGNAIVDATTRGNQAPQPARYLKHYRCDVSPDISIQRRAYDPGSDTLTEVIKGKRMVFRRGHFFATEQGEVDQIEWMMRHPSLDITGTQVIGGNPTIYEDDGKDLVKCAHCDEVFVAGSNSLKSHLRATHGIAI